MSSLREVVERQKQERERLLSGSTQHQQQQQQQQRQRAPLFKQSRAPPPARGSDSTSTTSTAAAGDENRIVRLYKQYFGTRKDVSVTEVEDIPDTGATSMARGQGALFLAAIIFGITLLYYIVFLKRSTIYPSGQEDGTPQYSYLHLGHVVDWFILILIGAFATVPEPVFFALLFEIIVLVADGIAATLRGIYVFDNVGLSSATVADWVNFALAIVFGFLSLFAVITLLQLYVGLKKKVAQFFVSKNKDSEFFATQVYVQALTLLVQMGFDATAIVKYAPELLAEPRRLWYLNASSTTHAMAGNFTQAEREDAMGTAVSSGQYLQDPNMGSLVYFKEMRDNGDRVIAQVRATMRQAHPEKYDPTTKERLEPQDGTGVSLERAMQDMERTGGRLVPSTDSGGAITTTTPTAASAAAAASFASTPTRVPTQFKTYSTPSTESIDSSRQLKPRRQGLSKRIVSSNSSSSNSNSSDVGRFGEENATSAARAPAQSHISLVDGKDDVVTGGGGVDDDVDHDDSGASSLTVQAMFAAEVDAMKNKHH